MMTANWPSPCSMFFGQRELDVQRAGVGGLGVLVEDGLAVDGGEHAQLGAAGGAPFRPLGLEIGRHGLAGAVTVAGELQFLLQPRQTITPDEELPLLRGKRAVGGASDQRVLPAGRLAGDRKRAVGHALLAHRIAAANRPPRRRRDRESRSEPARRGRPSNRNAKAPASDSEPRRPADTAGDPSASCAS